MIYFIRMNKIIKNKKSLVKAFKDISKKYAEDDLYREKIIILTREIIKPSKQAIYAVHKNEFNQANKLIVNAEKGISNAFKIFSKSNLKDIGSLKSALEEYVEAKTYLTFVRDNKLLLPNELFKEIHYETYLCGIADLTGEMSKRAVISATQGNFDDVKHIKTIIEDIYELFLSFNFRSGELRKKSESIKYNLSKVENILYDISIKR